MALGQTVEGTGPEWQGGIVVPGHKECWLVWSCLAQLSRVETPRFSQGSENAEPGIPGQGWDPRSGEDWPLPSGSLVSFWEILYLFQLRHLALAVLTPLNVGGLLERMG